jgi:hypothetical protein
MTRMTRIFMLPAAAIFQGIRNYDFFQYKIAEGNLKIRVIRVIRVPKKSAFQSAFQKIRVIRVIRVPKKSAF